MVLYNKNCFEGPALEVFYQLEVLEKTIGVEGSEDLQKEALRRAKEALRYLSYWHERDKPKQEEPKPQPQPQPLPVGRQRVSAPRSSVWRAVHGEYPLAALKEFSQLVYEIRLELSVPCTHEQMAQELKKRGRGISSTKVGEMIKSCVERGVPILDKDLNWLGGKRPEQDNRPTQH